MENSDWIESYFVGARNRALASHRKPFRGSNSSELSSWQEHARAELRRILRIDRLRAAPVEIAADAQHGTALPGRRDLLVRTEAEYWAPVTVLSPSEDGRKLDAVVIAAHGHGGGGRAAVIGNRNDPAAAAAIDKMNYDYGLQLAKRGFTVLCPEARGFGTRRSGKYDPGPMGSSCREVANLANAVGLTLAGLQTWDILRILDSVEAIAGIRPTAIGVVGFSGGGMQCLYAAALDDRISAAVVSGYFYGFAESLVELYGNCSCNYVPGLMEQFEPGDIASMIAPRRLFVETGRNDPLNGKSGVGNVLPQIEISRAAYAAAASEGNLVHRTYDGQHRFYGEDSLRWLAERI